LWRALASDRRLGHRKVIAKATPIFPASFTNLLNVDPYILNLFIREPSSLTAAQTSSIGKTQSDRRLSKHGLRSKSSKI
jgi:hypothetical protein